MADIDILRAKIVLLRNLGSNPRAIIGITISCPGRFDNGVKNRLRRRERVLIDHHPLELWLRPGNDKVFGVIGLNLINPWD